MQRRRGIGDEMARGQLDRFLACRALDHQFTTLVALRIGEEERERHVRAQPVHDRVVDMCAVGLADAVAAEEDRRQRLGPDRRREDGIGEDARRDVFAQAPHGSALAGLLVVLDKPGAAACRRTPVPETQAGQRFTNVRKLFRRQYISDEDEHCFSLR
jgi:hypothetical protein